MLAARTIIYPILADPWRRAILPAVAAPSILVVDTAEFRRWLRSLRDARARARILKSIDHLSLEHFGNTKSVGGGVSELRVDYGPGYRIYFARRGARLILLAYGGDKSRERADIGRAREIAASWEPDHGD
ncbi:MAG TPA: type II toxin-antitoxin system RelE/ParE family toxin [Allosphingosinicella sp.]|jgi:putative addiction module killer protein